MTAGPGAGRAGDGPAAGGGRLRRPLSVAVINYNGRDVLPATLAALERMGDDRMDVVVVDDGSDDGSPGWVEEHHPSVRVVRMGRNTGRPNCVRNVGLEAARHRLVFLTDNDVEVDPGCLATLLEVMLEEPDVLCCTPRLVYRSDPERLYHDGGALHYLCVSAAVPRGRRVADHPAVPPTPTVGGGIMLVDRRLAREIGGFDEGYLFGWGEDGDFHVRGRQAGLRVLQVSDAVARHAERSKGTDRALAQVYNRYRLLLTAYSARSLLLLAPALAAFEVALTAAAAAGGFLGDRFRGLARAIGSLGEIRARRREVQARRRVPDGRILVAGPLMTPGGIEGSRLAALGREALRSAADLYWRLVRRWL